MTIRKLTTILILVSIVPVVTGAIQVYSTDLGRVQIDMPYMLVPNDGGTSGGSSLQLGLKVTPTDWVNIMGINLHDLATYGAKSSEAFVNLWMGETSSKYELQEMLTNDYHTMWFYTGKGHAPYHYYAFIDYQKEKNCVVEIDALSEKYSATFDKNEFQDICKSFTFINEG